MDIFGTFSEVLDAHDLMTHQFAKGLHFPCRAAFGKLHSCYEPRNEDTGLDQSFPDLDSNLHEILSHRQQTQGSFRSFENLTKPRREDCANSSLFLDFPHFDIWRTGERSMINHIALASFEAMLIFGLHLNTMTPPNSEMVVCCTSSHGNSELKRSRLWLHGNPLPSAVAFARNMAMHWTHIMKYVTVAVGGIRMASRRLCHGKRYSRRIVKPACKEAALSPHGSPLVAPQSPKKKIHGGLHGEACRR